MTEWDVKKLRILRTLRDRGTVTATAEALLMTPSAVSQQLTNLARQLGVPLLEAQGRRVRLTDAAHLVLRHAEAVFAQLERADAELTGYLRGEAGQVRVGAFSTAVPALVVPAVRAPARPVTARAPTVRVREAEAAQALRAARRPGEVDLALSLAAHAPTARDPRFTLVPLLADPLDVALPAGHPLAGGARAAAGGPRRRALDLRRVRPLVGDHHRRLRGRGVRPRAGPQRRRLDRDPGHGAGGHGRRAGPPDGLGRATGRATACDAGPGGGPAVPPCGAAVRQGAERGPGGASRVLSGARSGRQAAQIVQQN